MEDYDELPILPGEATDLSVHVRACTLRWTALVRKLDRIETKMERQARINRKLRYLTLAYRAVLMTCLTSVAGLLWKIGEHFFAWQGL